MFGFLNMRKPAGVTSFDVVARLRKILGIKKIGHGGTLDPFAEGVLPIAVGKATRLIDYLKNEKAYIATLQFGKDTDTYDIEGKIIKEYNSKTDKANLDEILPCFWGDITQIPPKYSAIKVGGKKLCDLARKGQNIGKIEPRNIHISQIKLQKFDQFAQTAEIYVECSKGTYIRSLAFDIGQKLNCGAYLTRLIRTNSSGFLIENSLELDTENLAQKLENPLKYLDLPILEIDKIALEKVIHGNKFQFEVDDFRDLILLYNKEIAAIAASENSIISVKKVFYEKD